MRFRNREEAGVHLGYALSAHRSHDAVVLALPRGGVVVGYHVARALDAPLEILVCQKVRVPGHHDTAVGAVAEGGTSYVDVGRAQAMAIPPEELRHAVRAARVEVERRVLRYRGGRPVPHLLGRTVFLVDDGIATGATVRVAVDAIRDQMPRAVIVAVPVAARSVAEGLRLRADAVVCLETPTVLHGAGEWYEEFAPLGDAEVVEWLGRAQHRPAESGAHA